MKILRDRVLAVALGAALLIGGANIAAYAANGQPLMLGKANTETRAAVVTNKGTGPALDLRTKPAAPPLKVSSTQKVPKLNADQVDGKSANDLETAAYTFPVNAPTVGIEHRFELAVPPGLYTVSYQLLVSGNKPAICHLDIERPSGNSEALLSYGALHPLGSHYSTVTGSGPVDTTGATRTLLRCTSTEAIRITPIASTTPTVTFTRLDEHTTAPAVPPIARVAPRERPRAFR